MVIRKSLMAVVILSMTASLAACKSSEERADEHFQSALELMQAGDPERAIVEFRNVFKLNDQHRDGRLAFAELQEQRGNVVEAYAQYLRVAEKSPDDLDALKPMTRIAATMGDWEAVRKYGGHALELAPEDPGLKAAMIAADYADAVNKKDATARQAASDRAGVLLETAPDSLLLWQVRIDSALRDRRYGEALDALDAAIEIAPNNKELFLQRISVLANQGDDEAVEAGLLGMVEQFPDDPSVEQTLVRWYLAKGEDGKAEAYLRGQIETGDSGVEAQITLLVFLKEVRGEEEALEEVEKIVADGHDDPELRAMRAGLLFDTGNHLDAIAEMQALVDGGEENDQNRGFKVALAKMHLAEGDQVSARALIEQVIAEDTGQVEALKMKSAWLIQDDQTDEAIALLRAALDETPKDSQIMTLLAEAYQRTGDTDLRASMLSLAVEASNKAPAESIRYANYLAQDGKLKPAEGVLIDSLRLSPNNEELLTSLGAVYVRLGDWGRLETVISRLATIDTPNAAGAVKDMRLAMLRARNDQGEVLRYLQGLAEQENTSNAAEIEILRTHIANGDIEKARSFVNGLLADDPDNATLRFAKGALLASDGDWAGAEAAYRELVAEDSGRARVWVEIYKLLNAQGQQDAAKTALQDAIAANPEDSSLLWLNADRLEREHDIDGAIDVYEKLYARDTSNQIIANNLASLLASYHGDSQESLDRAFVVARRLNGTTVPPFADTYGWIIHLRGQSEEALSYLETAAAALTGDPVVQFHLGQIYETLDRPADAAVQYRKVLDLVGDLDEREFVQTARDAIERLDVATGD